MHCESTRTMEVANAHRNVLCDSCTGAISDIVSDDLDTARWKPFTRRPKSLALCVDKDNVLRNGLTEACQLCCRVIRSVSQEWSRRHEWPEPLSFATPIAFFFVYPTSTGTHVPFQESWLLEVCAVAEDFRPAVQPDGFFLPLRFEFFDAESGDGTSKHMRQIQQLEVACSPLMKMRLGTDKVSNSGSNKALELLRSWSTECLQNHPRCAMRRRHPLLPTRVIDVGPPGTLDSDAAYPRLATPERGQRGQYVTLSYRWPSSERQYRTLQRNVEAHTKHISMDALPQTFHDAVRTLRCLHIQFLWIDSLCIIQDDDRDWRKECKRMADIFKNSFFTLSALSSMDSSDGLFRDRWDHWEVGFRTRDNARIGLRRGPTTLSDDLRDSSMAGRGWIMQEKLLSPALAHFGHRQVHWECLTGTSSELWATTMVPTQGPWKHFLREIQRPGVEAYDDHHFIAWYMIVQHFSSMSLTVETDRLPAILGIARAFQLAFDVKFIAGLWAEDLHRGLLWHRYGLRRMDKAEPSSNSAAFKTSDLGNPKNDFPSWSWLRYAGRGQLIELSFEWFHHKVKGVQISMKPVRRLHSSTDLDVLSADTHSKTSARRSIMRGAIDLEGIVRKVRVVHYGLSGLGTCLVRACSMHDVSLENVLKVPPQVICRMDIEVKSCLDCYMLLVADWIFEDTHKGFFYQDHSPEVELRCFVLLRRIKRPRRNANPLALGHFQRIGMGAGPVSSVQELCCDTVCRRFLTIV